MSWTCEKCGKTWARECAHNCINNPLPTKPRMPTVAKQAWNLASSVAAFVLKPGFVSRDDYAVRLAICDACELRNGTRCSKCGCNLAAKAAGKAWECPEGKWPK